MAEINRMHHSSPRNDPYLSENLETAESSRLEARIKTILSNCDRLNVLVNKEPQAARRANAKVRVDQLKADVRGLQSAFATFQARRFQTAQDLRDRDTLLSMTFTTNAEAAHAGQTSEISGRENPDTTSVLIDRAMAQNEALGRSNRAVDDILNQGSSMLGNK